MLLPCKRLRRDTFTRLRAGDARRLLTVRGRADGDDPRVQVFDRHGGPGRWLVDLSDGTERVRARLDLSGDPQPSDIAHHTILDVAEWTPCEEKEPDDDVVTRAVVTGVRVVRQAHSPREGLVPTLALPLPPEGATVPVTVRVTDVLGIRAHAANSLGDAGHLLDVVLLDAAGVVRHAAVMGDALIRRLSGVLTENAVVTISGGVPITDGRASWLILREEADVTPRIDDGTIPLRSYSFVDLCGIFVGRERAAVDMVGIAHRVRHVASPRPTTTFRLADPTADINVVLNWAAPVTSPMLAGHPVVAIHATAPLVVHAADDGCLTLHGDGCRFQVNAALDGDAHADRLRRWWAASTALVAGGQQGPRETTLEQLRDGIAAAQFLQEDLLRLRVPDVRVCNLRVFFPDDRSWVTLVDAEERLAGAGVHPRAASTMCRAAHEGRRIDVELVVSIVVRDGVRRAFPKVVEARLCEEMVHAEEDE